MFFNNKSAVTTPCSNCNKRQLSTREYCTSCYMPIAGFRSNRPIPAEQIELLIRSGKRVRAAKIILFTLAGLLIFGCIIMLLTNGFDSDTKSSFFLGMLFLVLGLWSRYNPIFPIGINMVLFLLFLIALLVDLFSGAYSEELVISSTIVTFITIMTMRGFLGGIHLFRYNKQLKSSNDILDA